jgi:transcriptional regulator with XRE-family HTH domain
MYLPSSAQDALKTLGAEIRLARKRRNWTIAELASKMDVSSPTIIALEKGQSTVSMGIVFSALWILGLEKELALLSRPEDKVGFELLNRRLPQKVRHSTRKINNEF